MFLMRVFLIGGTFMTKNFSLKEARNVMAKHKSLSKSLCDIIAIENSLKLNINNSANKLVEYEVFKVLSGISVDELKRYKKGLRIKPLIDNYYISIADIYNLSLDNLVAVKGISRDSAYIIKCISDDITDATRKEIKIKLSFDNMESTQLVKNISIYKNTLPHIERVYSIMIEYYNGKIQYLLQDLKVSTNIFRWFFASKINKNKSIEAYNTLKELLTGNYYNQIQTIISNVRKTLNIDVNTAREDFLKNEECFYKILKENVKGIGVVDYKNEKNQIRRLNGCDTNYYDELMNKTYLHVVDCLLHKYGQATGDYFVNETCRSKNKKISRTREGLFCHHIDENKAILLSNDKYAANNPFEYQKADRLVYCNFLEHLLLHIKIAEEPRDIGANKNEIQGIGGAVNFIVRQLNSFYSGQVPTVEYLVVATSVVENEYSTYIKMLRYLWNIVKSTPLYSQRITKEQLAMNWNGKVIHEIYNKLD